MAVSHKKLSTWYLQISQSLDAGLPLPEALALAKGPPPADTARMVTNLKGGVSLDDVLEQAPRWLDKADRYLLSAAGSSGRLPDAMRKLSEKHDLAAKNISSVVFATIYPLGVLHFGIFLFPILNLFEFTADSGMKFHLEAYAGDVLVILLPLWLVTGTIIILARRKNPLVKKLMRILPGLRGYCKFQALTDFTFALESFLSAGAPMVETWFAAGMVSGDPKLEKAALALTDYIRIGHPPGQHLGEHAVFPTEFVTLYQTGEQTGQLEANLVHLHGQLQDKANKSLSQASFWYPKLIFLVLAFYAGYKILVFYSHYLKGIMKMIE